MTDARAQPSAVTLVIYPGAAAAGAPARTLELTQPAPPGRASPTSRSTTACTPPRCEALGASGKTGRSAPVTFRVDTVAPQPALTRSRRRRRHERQHSRVLRLGRHVRRATRRRSACSSTPGSATPARRWPASPRAARARPSPCPRPSALPVGTYTARAEQQDGAGNTGRSAPRTFAVTSTAAAATYRDAVMADAPRAYWRLGEASGTARRRPDRLRQHRRLPGLARARPGRHRARGAEHGDGARRLQRLRARADLGQPQPDGGAEPRDLDPAGRASRRARRR